MTAWTMVVLAKLVSAGSLTAQHSLVRFDVPAPVWVTGTVVAVEIVNPHGKTHVDQDLENGQVQRPIPKIRTVVERSMRDP